MLGTRLLPALPPQLRQGRGERYCCGGQLEAAAAGLQRRQRCALWLWCKAGVNAIIEAGAACACRAALRAAVSQSAGAMRLGRADEDPEISGLYILDKDGQQHIQDSIPFISESSDLYLINIDLEMNWRKYHETTGFPMWHRRLMHCPLQNIKDTIPFTKGMENLKTDRSSGEMSRLLQSLAPFVKALIMIILGLYLWLHDHSPWLISMSLSLQLPLSKDIIMLHCLSMTALVSNGFMV